MAACRSAAPAPGAAPEMPGAEEGYELALRHAAATWWRVGGGGSNKPLARKRGTRNTGPDLFYQHCAVN